MSCSSHLLGGQVLHAPGHLVGTGHQVLDGHVFYRNLVRVVAVLHAWGAAGTQVFPQVSFGGVFHDHVERSCRQRAEETSEAEEGTGTSSSRRSYRQFIQRSQQKEQASRLFPDSE